MSGLNVLALGIYVEVLQRWLGDITGVYARGKTITPVRQGYEVMVPDLLTVLCRFESGAEGVLEFSGINALAPERPARSLRRLRHDDVRFRYRRGSKPARRAIALCTRSR